MHTSDCVNQIQYCIRNKDKTNNPFYQIPRNKSQRAYKSDTVCSFTEKSNFEKCNGGKDLSSVVEHMLCVEKELRSITSGKVRKDSCIKPWFLPGSRGLMSS